MKRKILSVILTLSIVLSGCSSNNNTVSTTDNNSTEVASADVNEETSTNGDENSEENENKENENKEIEDTEKEVEEKTEEETEETAENNNEETESGKVINTSILGDKEEIYYDENLVPSIPDYKVNDDFSNVVYDDKFSYMFDTKEESEYNHPIAFRQGLIDNMFVVRDGQNDEFFDVYEANRYNYFPNFVTVDSLMHTYHLYFSYLMKKTETSYIVSKLENLNTQMMSKSLEQYEELKGTDYEKAALRNLEFFYIGSLLLDDSVKEPINDSEFSEVTKNEYEKIIKAEGIENCSISDLFEDYTQYKPRGYYEGDEKLEKYFRSMMWYGRIGFNLENDDTIRSAILITLAIADKPDDWDSIYKITSFFAGTSDDPGYNQFVEIIKANYGKIPDSSEIAANDEMFQKVKEQVNSLALPKINSIPVNEDEEAVIPSFRFMGQRFTIDAAIMQRLIYRSVGEKENGERRYLPDTLDTAATLGSETAMSILDENGDTKYQNYTDNMTALQKIFGGDDPETWNVSLYSGWLNTLRPLFDKKGDGYPSYMKSDEWEKKDLETFAGSYAELKHDTILYAKQVLAEMGGPDDEEIPDDRGYVDPEPVIYSRFAYLSNKTKEGLDGFGMLDADDKKNLELLSEIAMKLLNISEKELKNEALSDDDYDFIRTYGGNLEHFWLEVNKGSEEEIIYSYQAPCPVIADIATDPNGQVLEVGSGKADIMYVVFPIDGELHVGSGSVYSFYQFSVPISERMTDSEWRNALSGGYLDDDWNWIENDKKPEKPEWTMSYRFK
ncbi:DUF3160 domain-containing protein [Butyrivibrio sp. JL13D10]|uniref:DUF3160 domain-containing protein n=1 Tax=Butyrivibrio sp. JL13D10 TaxID=3236815 RepID=UPI0038B44444